MDQLQRVAGLLASCRRAPSYGRDQNAQRYHDWSTALDASPDWHQATAFPHPQFDPAAFFLHDAGVLELQEPAPMSQYGALPEQGFLDTVPDADSGPARRFTVVGYGLNKVHAARLEVGGDTRFTGTVQLVTLKGLFGRPAAPPRGYEQQRDGAPGRDLLRRLRRADVLTHRHQRIVVTVTSFGISPNCTGTDDEYRIDQPDDLAFLAGFGVTP